MDPYMLVRRLRLYQVVLVWIVAILAATRSAEILAQETQPITPVSRDTLPTYTEAVEAHLGYVTDYSVDEYGPIKTGAWLGQIDIRTSQLPSIVNGKENHDLFEAKTNLYLDQPTMVAAMEMGRITGCKCYQESITRYLQTHLVSLKATTPNPLLFSLTHDYDLRGDSFAECPSQYSLTCYSPAWEILAYESPELTKRSIETLIAESYKASQLESIESLNHTQPPHSFGDAMNTRAIALSSIAWFCRRYQDDSESFRHHAAALSKLSPSESKRLVAVEPKILASWTNALIECSKVTNTEISSSLQYLNEIQLSPEPNSVNTNEVSKQHTDDSDHTRKEGPDHDSSYHLNDASLSHHLALGEACLSAWLHTKNREFLLATKSHAEEITDQLQRNTAIPTKAETFGRMIHFYVRFGDATENRDYLSLARELADKAMSSLYEPRLGMFRSKLDSDICDARDGTGFLLIALLMIEGNDPTLGSAMKF